MNKIMTLIAAGTFSLGVSAASAATDLFTNGGCLVTDVTNAGSNADDCFGLIETADGSGVGDDVTLLNSNRFHNNSVSDWLAGNSGGITNGLFGASDWSYGGTVQGTGTNGDLTVGDGTFSWGGDAFSQMVVVLRQAGGISTYLFDGGLTNGTWETTQAVFGSAAGGLTHLAVYFRGDATSGPSVVSTPIPAAGFLLVGGLGGLMLMRRRSS